MKQKKNYEAVSIEITLLKSEDVITTSGAFDGEDDSIASWG